MVSLDLKMFACSFAACTGLIVAAGGIILAVVGAGDVDAVMCSFMLTAAGILIAAFSWRSLASYRKQAAVSKVGVRGGFRADILPDDDRSLEIADGYCPNCGSPAAPGRCAVCGAELSDGEASR